VEEISHILTRISELLIYPPYSRDPSARLRGKGHLYEVRVRWLVGEDYLREAEVLAKANPQIRMRDKGN